MFDRFTELYEICEKQYQIMTQVAEALRKEREHLINLDSDKLDEGNKLKEGLILKFNVLEKSRQQVAGNIAEVLNISENPPSLKTIAIRAPEPFSGKLMSQRKKLREVVEKTSELADLNRQILNTSAKNAKTLTDLIIKQVNGEPDTYGPPSKKQPVKTSSTSSGRTV